MRAASPESRQEPARLEIARAEGSFVFDARGRAYIDFVMGWCVGNLGWAHPAIEKRLRAFEGPTYVEPGRSYPPWDELGRRLAELAPGRLEHHYRATGGTEAVDIAMQVAAAFTGRRGFLALKGGYHGNSAGTASLGRTSPRTGVSLPYCFALAPRFDHAFLDAAEKLLAKRTIAAFVMEPTVISLGVLVPPPGFVQELAARCRRYGTLFIADEVACGFGRTGKLFACEHHDLEPDILCVAKPLTGGHAPMGATLTTRAIAQAVEDKVSFWSTFGWHPLGVEAALANVAYFAQHRGTLMANVAARSRDVSEAFARMSLPAGSRVRIQGLAIAVELGEGAAEGIVARCRERGLLVGGEKKRITLSPALTLDRATARQGLEILARCVAEG
jgi:4-aminobutyrate aminotransferase-like enzyme